MVNLNKYKDKKFSNKGESDKKIKALFLLYDKNVEELKLSWKKSMELIDAWIKVFVAREEYELASAFNERKIRRRRKWKKIKRVWSAELFYRVWRKRINKLIK
jgi:hypothetical protein